MPYALCNAHHLRELKALVEIEKEDWAHKMQRLLRRACHATNLAREQGVLLTPGLIALIERSYDAILAAGLEFHEAQPALAKRQAPRSPTTTGWPQSAAAPEHPQIGRAALPERSRCALLHQQPGGSRTDG